MFKIISPTGTTLTDEITFTAKTPQELVLKMVFLGTLLAQQRGGEQEAERFLDKALSIINE